MSRYPCPKCGCAGPVERGLHERWGCWLDEPDAIDVVSPPNLEESDDSQEGILECHVRPEPFS